MRENGEKESEIYMKRTNVIYTMAPYKFFKMTVTLTTLIYYDGYCEQMNSFYSLMKLSSLRLSGDRRTVKRV